MSAIFEFDTDGQARGMEQTHAAATLWATLDGLERQAKDTGLSDLAFFIGLARVAAEEFLRDATQDEDIPALRN
jgi:hypothetical protein